MPKQAAALNPSTLQSPLAESLESIQIKPPHLCFPSPQNWLCGTFPASRAPAVTSLWLIPRTQSSWLCSNTLLNKSRSRVQMSEVTPNDVSLSSYSTCSLGHATVLRGPGLEPRDTAWCQDNQQSTIMKTCGTLWGGADGSPTDISIAQISQHQHLSATSPLGLITLFHHRLTVLLLGFFLLLASFVICLPTLLHSWLQLENEQLAKPWSWLSQWLLAILTG